MTTETAAPIAGAALFTLHVHYSVAEAVRAGHTKFGLMPVQLDLAQLSQPQRALLSDLIQLGRCGEPCLMTARISEHDGAVVPSRGYEWPEIEEKVAKLNPSPEAVVAYLTDLLKKRDDRKAAIRRADQEREERNKAANEAGLARNVAAIKAFFETPWAKAPVDWKWGRHGQFNSYSYLVPKEAIEEVRAEIGRREDALAAAKTEREATDKAAGEALILQAVTSWGAEGQKARHEAGVLPIQEARKLVANMLYGPLANFVRPPRIDIEPYKARSEAPYQVEFSTEDYDPKESGLTDVQFQSYQDITKAAAAIEGAEISVMRQSVEDDDVIFEERLVARVRVTRAGLEPFSRDYLLG